jgi:protease II
MPTMPSMPTISSPSVKTKPTVQNNKQTSNTKSNGNANSQNQNPSVSAASLLQMSSSNPLGSITDLNSILSNLSTEKTTEADLSSLSTLSSTLLNSSSLTSTNNSVATNTILTQILQRLEQLQAQVDKINSQPQQVSEKNLQNKNEVQTNTTQQQISESKNNQNKILRFKINNYDLTKSFTTLFFSEKEKDGSFLLTGDRVYNLYGKQMSETFYMLFKNENGNNFEVAVALNQNDENQNSFLYKFAKDSPYKSQRTGNLFFINSNKNDLKIDILIEN